MEGALKAQEARREIGDPDGIAVAVLEHGLVYGGVAHVARRRLLGAAEQNVAEALFLIAGDEVGKDGVGIEARKAPPRDAPLGCDKRGDAPVTDGGNVEVGGIFHRRLLKSGKGNIVCHVPALPLMP